MAATVHHLPLRTPQPAPTETSESPASRLALMYQHGIAEGERRAYERLGITDATRLITEKRFTVALAAADFGSSSRSVRGALNARWPDGVPS